MPHDVVVHPTAPRGVPEALARIPGVSAITPDDVDGVHQALARGAQILATYLWEDRWLGTHLRWLAGEGAGFEHYPLEAIDEAGIVLTTATGVHRVSVSEHAIGLLLALTRRIGEASRNAVEHDWDRMHAEDLAGKTIAIVGLGAIGEAIAERLIPFGPRLLGVRRDVGRGGDVVDELYGPDDLLTVCALADIVVLVLPGGDATEHIIGDQALEAIGEGWLVNVGRGSVVDEDALVRALTSGRLRGAALDVFEEEPLPADSPLWDLSNVVVTPHMAGETPAYGTRFAQLFEQNLAAFEGRGTWVNRVVDGRRRDRWPSG